MRKYQYRKCTNTSSGKVILWMKTEVEIHSKEDEYLKQPLWYVYSFERPIKSAPWYAGDHLRRRAAKLEMAFSEVVEDPEIRTWSMMTIFQATILLPPQLVNQSCVHGDCSKLSRLWTCSGQKWTAFISALPHRYSRQLRGRRRGGRRPWRPSRSARGRAAARPWATSRSPSTPGGSGAARRSLRRRGHCLWGWAHVVKQLPNQLINKPWG